MPTGAAALAAFSTAALGAGLGRALVTTYLPVLLEHIRDAPGLIGTVMLVNAVAGFLAPLWIGVWSDRLARRGQGRVIPFVLGGSVVTALALLAIALGNATSYLLLGLLALIAYVGLNAVTTAHRALIPEAFTPTRRAEATGAEELAMLAGGLAGVVAGGVLIELAGWAPFLLGAFALPLLAVPTVRRMRDVRPPARAAASHTPERGTVARAYLTMASRPGVRSILGAQALWVFGYLGLPPFFILYAKNVLDLSPSVAGAALAVFGIATGAAMLGAGRAGIRAHVPLLLLGVALMGAGLIAVAPASSLAYAAPGFAATAAGFGLVSTLGFPVLARSIPRGEEGAYTALYFSVRAIAAAGAVPAAGWTIHVTDSYRSLVLVGGALTLLALIPLTPVALAERATQVRPPLPSPRWLAGWLGGIVGLIGTSLAIGLLVVHTPLRRADAWLFEALQGGAVGDGILSALLDEVAFANYVALTVVAIAAALVRRNVLATVLLVPGAGLLAWGVVRVVWALVERERPEELLGSDTVHSWAHVSSYPSGHVAVSVAMIAATAWLFPVLRWPLWGYAAVLSGSRVFFGAHFPTDVLVGIAIGYASALLARALLVKSGIDVPARPPSLGIPHLEISLRTRVLVGRVALVTGALALATFFLLAETVGFPQNPDGALLAPDLQVDLQDALLRVAGIGLATAVFHRMLGGALVVGAALPLGVLAAFEYDPLVALLAFLAFFTPGVLLLAAGIHTRNGALALGAALAAVVASGGVAAGGAHAYLTGPTHPASQVAAVPVDLVEWVWSGNVTTSEFTVKARLAADADEVRLLVHGADGTTRSIRGAFTAERVGSFHVSGLKPATSYRYEIEADGQIERTRNGRVRTFPAANASFSFAFGSCARVGTNGAVFDAIRRTRPLFFLAVGDLFYGNVARDDPGAFRGFYDRLLSQPGPGAVFDTMPIAYTWDDHDFGPDGATGESPSAPAAQQVYRERVPHYALPAGARSGPIYQAFTSGRVRFILTDIRSARDSPGEPDGPQKTMLGAAQKAWLKGELLRGRDRYALVVWVNPVPWIGPASEGADGWAGYASERRELADFVAAERISNILMLSGDAHMLAIDDGSNSDYSTTGRAGFPVMHAAALDKHGGVKGGPYSEGAYPGSGQFGVVTVRDSGEIVTVALSGRDYSAHELVHYEFTVSGKEPRP
jgi:phosphodiesterase/alkaline phosphatase D-like protein/MFS family permease